MNIINLTDEKTGKILAWTCVPWDWYTSVRGLYKSWESSLQNPMIVEVFAASDDRTEVMKYLSSRNYLDRMQTVKGKEVSPADGEKDYDTQYTFFGFMEAPEYNDYLITGLSNNMTNIKIVEDVDLPDAEKNYIEQAGQNYADYLVDRLSSNNNSELGWTYLERARTIYSYNDDGTPMMAAVDTTIKGYQMTHDVNGVSTEDILWEVLGSYTYSATEESFDKNLIVFDHFVNNTRMSDEANKAYTAVYNYIGNGKTDVDNYKESEIEAVVKKSMPDTATYTSVSGYPKEEKTRDDAIGQTDYTLSNGSRIKITDGLYNYIFEDSAGNAYVLRHEENIDLSKVKEVTKKTEVNK